MTPTLDRPPCGTRLRRRLLAAALAFAGLVTVCTTTAAGASAPHAGTRATVPWSKIGPGWHLVTWGPTEHSRATLFIVAPDGHRWSVARLNPYAGAVAWSPDHRRAVVRGRLGMVEIDLRTGHGHAVRLPSNIWRISYTRPAGRALLVEMGVPHHGYLVDRLERFDEYGRHQKTYPRTVKGAGLLTVGDVVETADGAHLVLGADRGLVVLRNDGTVLRRLMTGSGRCSYPSWRSAGVVVASCDGRVWAVPVSGAKARALTAGPAGQNQFGYSTAWDYSRGRLGLAINGCGPASLVRFGAHGKGVRVTVPGPGKHAVKVTYVGHHGDVVNFLARREQGCVSGNETLIGYNAVTRRSTALLGPGVNGGTVLVIVPDSTR